MRHFATESGKSKGQFYTPAEVSRVIAQVLGIKQAKTTTDTTVYDPACGSGSLLLKVGDEAGTLVTLYGQEKDAATSGLARMNMILHNNPTALIVQGNTGSRHRTGRIARLECNLLRGLANFRYQLRSWPSSQVNYSLFQSTLTRVESMVYTAPVYEGLSGTGWFGP